MTMLLSVENQTVRIATPRGVVTAVDDVSVSLNAGETLGIVGESGSGKSVLCRSLLRLLPKSASAGAASKVMFQGKNLNELDEVAMRRLRGPELAIVFQDPMTALNPVLTVGRQVSEGLRVHRRMSRRAAWRRAIELLDEVGIPEAGARARQFPHQLSGGLRQRVAIAIALSCEPKLLIADEPTTALDVTVQAEILDLLYRAQRERGMAMILISHDLAVVAGRTDRVAVMYAGRIVENAETTQLFTQPRMPYTAALLAAIPRIHAQQRMKLRGIAGRPPDLLEPPAGCVFGTRCQYKQDKCIGERPVLRAIKNRQFACWFPLDGTGQTT